MKTYNVLGVPITDLNLVSATQLVSDTIKNNKKIQIATVNNEFLVEAHKNPKLAKILIEESVNTCDSTGVSWAIGLLHKTQVGKIPGVDFVNALMARGSESSFFLLGGKSGIGNKAKKVIEEKYGAKICGVIDGVKIDVDADNSSIIEKINKSGAKIVLVALGSPKQEFFSSKFKDKIKANVFIGVGGTLDFISGSSMRAPAIMRKIGLEWLWRFVLDPRRYKRMFKALIIFPAMVLISWAQKS